MVVTGVVPCHNHVSFVKSAIYSLLTQAEISRVVVIDDGSTDGSLSKIFSIVNNPYESFVGRVDGWMLNQVTGKRVDVWVLANKTPKGPAATRNRGIIEAQNDTDFFCLCDADDYYNPGAVGALLAELGDDPMKAMAYGDHRTLHLDIDLPIKEYRRPFDYQELRHWCQPHSNCLIRKSALMEAGLFEESLRVAEDYDLWLRLSEKFILCHVPLTLTVHRVTQKNSTQMVPPEVWQACWAKVNEREKQRRCG